MLHRYAKQRKDETFQMKLNSYVFLFATVVCFINNDMDYAYVLGCIAFLFELLGELCFSIYKDHMKEIQEMNDALNPRKLYMSHFQDNPENKIVERHNS